MRRFALLLLAPLLVLPGACQNGGAENVPLGPAAEWEILRPAPNQRTEVAAAAVGNRIYVIGGFTPPGRTVAIVEVYDTESDTWSRAPDLPIAVNHAMGAASAEVAFVLGGYQGANDLTSPTNRVFGFWDGSWREMPPMPEPRAAGGAVAIDRKLYVAGGVGPEGLAESTFVLDLDSGEWSTEAGLATPREHLGVATDGERIYAVGGRPPNTDAAEVFDPETGEWDQLADMPTARGGLAATGTANGLIVAAGGEAEETFAEVEAFDVNAGSWLRLEGLPTPRHGLGVVAVGNRVYVLSGGPRPGFAFSGANEVLDLSSAGS